MDKQAAIAELKALLGVDAGTDVAEAFREWVVLGDGPSKADVHRVGELLAIITK